MFTKYLDKFGFPLKPTPDNKISIKFEKKIYLFSKFMRKFDVCCKLPSFDFIDRYYHDSFLEKFYYNQISTFTFFKIFKFRINLRKFIKYFNIFFKNKKINLKKKDLVLFGPYSNSYHHVLYEFLLRLIYLKKINFKSQIWLPDNLKIYVNSRAYKNIFGKLKLRFFNTKKNLLFENCNYLTHANTRWIIKNKKKTISAEFLKLIKLFRKTLFNKNKFSKNRKYEYIIVSRTSSLRRKLINELDLYKTLKKYKFELIYFENYSFHEQINIARNCKVMIGYHGGGLSNILFMNSKNYLIEILNKNYDHKLYAHISRSLGLKYKNFLCEKSLKNLDGFCDIDEIERFIKKII